MNTHQEGWRIHPHQWAYSRVYSRLSKYVDKEFLTEQDAKELEGDVNVLIKELRDEGLPLHPSVVDTRIVDKIETFYDVNKDTDHIDKDTWVVKAVVFP